ncbi:hypothetical protein C1A50_5204 [Paenibacillus polymyxa]|nr:hypothetical protein C1A50_5204 [Paenibacillus polymyxa]
MVWGWKSYLFHTINSTKRLLFLRGSRHFSRLIFRLRKGELEKDMKKVQYKDIGF